MTDAKGPERRAFRQALATIADESDETTIIDGYELPVLNDQRNTLKCAVQSCCSSYSRVWSYAADRRQDPRRICERCTHKWRDVSLHYPTTEPIYDADVKPARVMAAAELQAACRRALIRAQRARHVRAAVALQTAERARAARACAT